MLRLGLLLCGNGALDGTDPLQAIAWRIAAARRGHVLIATAPHVDQHDVVGPQGVQRDATRHAFAESMRLAGGVVESVDALRADEIDALVVPGGLGTVKTLCSAAVSAPVEVLEGPRRLARELLDRGGLVAAEDEATIWLAWALADRALTLATDGRETTTRDLEAAGHTAAADEGIVRDHSERVLTRWISGPPQPARRFDAIVELLERIERELDPSTEG